MEKLLQDLTNLKMNLDILEADFNKELQDGIDNKMLRHGTIGEVVAIGMINVHLTKILKTYYDRENSSSETKKRATNKKVRTNKSRANAKNGNSSKRLHSKK